MDKLAPLLAVAAALFATSAAGQGYPGYQPPPMPGMARIPKVPEPPKPPKPPEFPTPHRFEPFKGQHIDPAPGGLDPYPAPKKPKGGFSPYGH